MYVVSVYVPVPGERGKHFLAGETINIGARGGGGARVVIYFPPSYAKLKRGGHLVGPLGGFTFVGDGNGVSSCGEHVASSLLLEL